MVEKLLRIEEAAKVLRVAVSTLRIWTLDRKIPCVRLGSRVLFTEQQLQDIVDAGKTQVSPFSQIVPSPFLDMWREAYIFDPDFEAEGRDLYERYREWCRENKQRALSRQRFSNELLKVSGVGKRLDGKTRRVIYMGVKLRR